MIFLKNGGASLPELSDQDLIETILKTESKELIRQLQGELYDRYADKVYFKCISLVKNQDVAKDLAHDILVKMFLKLDTYRGDSPFYGWVYAIAYNYCISYLQKEKKLVLEEYDSHSFELSTDKIETENQELKEMQLTHLERLVEELNDGERLILFMRYQDGLSVRDISESLQISESAVKMRLKRSRDRLAELFKKHDYYV